MLDERSVQTISTPFNIFKNKENVDSMLNESLNQFKFDSTHFQPVFFYAFNSVKRPVQTPPTFASTTVLNSCWSKRWNVYTGLYGPSAKHSGHKSTGKTEEDP